MEAMGIEFSRADAIGYRVYVRLAGMVRTSPSIHRFLFGYRPAGDESIPGEYWDWTTLILRRALRRYLSPDDAFLDMGTGPVAVLAIYARLKLGCEQVRAVDHVEPLVAAAKKNMENLGLDIPVYCSDLFEEVDGAYDVIAFNAPYLDSEKGRRLGILNSDMASLRFDGGSGGGEVIERFLRDAPRYLSDKGRVLLGVNHFHIASATIRKLISDSDMTLAGWMKSPILRGCAYILRRKQPEDAA